MDKALPAALPTRQLENAIFFKSPPRTIFRYARTTVEDAAHYYGMKGGVIPVIMQKRMMGEGSWDEGSEDESIMIYEFIIICCTAAEINYVQED